MTSSGDKANLLLEPFSIQSYSAALYESLSVTIFEASVIMSAMRCGRPTGGALGGGVFPPGTGAGSAGRTMIPSSSIQIPFGILMTPNRSAIKWLMSISDGCSAFAASINGRHDSAPKVSIPTVTISSPRVCTSFRKACHTGKSREQPQ